MCYFEWSHRYEFLAGVAVALLAGCAYSIALLRMHEKERDLEKFMDERLEFSPYHSWVHHANDIEAKKNTSQNSE